jgi:purine-nucleoside phosphorylase
MADLVHHAIDIPYAESAGVSGAGRGGHAGSLRAGAPSAAARRVVVLAGRKHAYETGDADGMKGAMRTLAALACQLLVQTNAAGSLEPSMPPGSS